VVTTVEYAFAHSIDDFKWLDHGASWQIFDFQAATRHFVDAGDVLLRHFAENFIGAPRTLHLENDGRLSNGNEWRTHQWNSYSGCGSLAKETATAGHGALASA